MILNRDVTIRCFTYPDRKGKGEGNGIYSLSSDDEQTPNEDDAPFLVWGVTTEGN